MPTFPGLAALPAVGLEMAGESFIPPAGGQGLEALETLFFQLQDNRAIRTNKWTLAEMDGSGWELLNVLRNPLEPVDVGSANPQIVADLESCWLEWWKEQSVKASYRPDPTSCSPHYNPQGDRGSGARYQPSAMPAALADRYPTP